MKENVVDFMVQQNSEGEAILKRYEINGQNVILYFDEVNETLGFYIGLTAVCYSCRLFDDIKTFVN